MGQAATRLMTLGHGTARRDQLTTLLSNVGVEHLVDVRAFPGSKRNPHTNRDQIAGWLDEAGISYAWEPRLGGRRRGQTDSPHTALRDQSFRAYADHMTSEEFAEALTALLSTAGVQRTAVMCSESVWWRCHRRLIADAAALLRGVTVLHLFHDERRQEHPPTAEARVAGDALIYDSGAATLPGSDEGV